jgi:hypothetical protein
MTPREVVEKICILIGGTCTLLAVVGPYPKQPEPFDRRGRRLSECPAVPSHWARRPVEFPDFVIESHLLFGIDQCKRMMRDRSIAVAATAILAKPSDLLLIDISSLYFSGVLAQ